MDGEFKPGDLLECVIGTNYSHGENVYLGKVYTFEGYVKGGTEVKLKDNNLYWFSNRFKLVTASHKQNKGIMTLPTDSNDRKNYPLFRGCLRYFPAALSGVSKISKLGNDKHNPGEEMHHARGKSPDHGDCVIRHLLDVEDLLAALNRGDTTVTPENILAEASQLVWRALAFSQELHEKFGSPMAPGAKK